MSDANGMQYLTSIIPLCPSLSVRKIRLLLLIPSLLADIISCRHTLLPKCTHTHCTYVMDSYELINAFGCMDALYREISQKEAGLNTSEKC